MVWINWKFFTDSWLTRAKRELEYVDDGDRFISLWIAFNGWMKGKFGEALTDSDLIARVKNSEDIERVFKYLKSNDTSFIECLKELSGYTVAKNRKKRKDAYDGTFDSLMDVIYLVRCNLFHGRKDVKEDERDIALVRLSYRILLPLLEAWLRLPT